MSSSSAGVKHRTTVDAVQGVAGHVRGDQGTTTDQEDVGGAEFVDVTVAVEEDPSS